MNAVIPEALSKTRPQPLREESRAGRLVFVGLLGVVLLAPLPLGADRPLAWDALGLAIAVLLAASFTIPRREFGRFPRDLLPAVYAITAVLCYVMVQVAVVIPHRLDNPIWDQAAEALGHSLQGSIAVDRHAALVGAFRLISYAGVFYLAHALGRNTAGSRLGVTAICVGGTVYAAYALVVYWLGNHTLLWLSKWAYLDDLTGTFVNRNSFATFLGVCVLATLCRLVMSLRRLHFGGTWQDKARISIEFLSAQSWLLVCIFLQSTALLLTHSRGGNLATLFGILVFALALSRAPSVGRARYRGMAAVAVLAVLVALLVSGGGVFTRFLDADSDAEGRLAIYTSTLQAIADHPLLGTGLGSFVSVFPLYRSDSIPTGFVNAAHNDYLETLLELGIPAAMALFFSIVWLVALCVRGLRRRHRDAAFPCLGVAVSALVGLHALIDFSLQIPAVTVTYLFLLGLGVAQSRSSA